MADYFNSTPNFTNPSYASPEQLAQQRAYAAELSKRSGENVNRPAGAAANVIDAITAALTRNSANQIQNQQAGQNSQDMSALVAGLQRGGGPGNVDPQNLARMIANPLVSPEQRALALKLMTPEPANSVYGQPAYSSPATGVQPATVNQANGPYTSGYRVEQGAEGVHTNAPIPAPGASPMGPQMPPPPPPVSAPGAGAPAPVVPSPGATAPVAPNGAPSGPMSLDQLAAKGREFAAQHAFTQGTAESQTNVAKGDIDAAATAPTIKRVAGTMLDDLRAHGDKMTFGPTAEWSNNVKRIAANYAPGAMKSELEALASADSFDKMSAQLTSLLARGGGTDAQLFNNMKSVPGAHNSKEGAEALLKMTIQVADQQQALRQVSVNAKTPQDYEALRNQFFAKNPIINPITGNPIALDLKGQAAQTAPNFVKTATNPTTKERMGQLPDGSWVKIP